MPRRSAASAAPIQSVISRALPPATLIIINIDTLALAPAIMESNPLVAGFKETHERLSRRCQRTIRGARRTGRGLGGPDEGFRRARPAGLLPLPRLQRRRYRASRARRGRLALAAAGRTSDAAAARGVRQRGRRLAPAAGRRR